MDRHALWDDGRVGHVDVQGELREVEAAEVEEEAEDGVEGGVGFEEVEEGD